MRSDAQFKSTSSTFNPFGHNLLFLMHLLICFLLNGPAIEKLYKWTLKRLKLGMVSSFHPHSICKKVERVMAKTGCTSCIKRTISFKVSGFHPETRLLQRDFIFTPYLNSWLFVCSKCTIQSHIIIFQSFSTSFVIFHAFTNYSEL